MLRTGVIPIPAARNPAGLVTSLCNVNDPLGRLTLSLVPNAAAFRAVLKPVPRIRIAIMIGSLSRGELASEKVRQSCPGQFFADTEMLVSTDYLHADYRLRSVRCTLSRPFLGVLLRTASRRFGGARDRRSTCFVYQDRRTSPFIPNQCIHLAHAGTGQCTAHRFPAELSMGRLAKGKNGILRRF